MAAGSHALSGQCAEQLNTRVLEFIADGEHRDPSTRRACPPRSTRRGLLSDSAGVSLDWPARQAWTLLVPGGRGGPFGVDMVGEVRLPGSTHARLGTTTSDPGWRGSPRLPT